MPKYDLKTPLEVSAAAKLAGDYASRERNQNSYNTAWLHGYAYALKEVAEQQLQYAKDFRKTDVLREVLSLAESELNENGSLGYTMPDGKHHIYIYVDFPEEENRLYIIEPNRVIDGACEPMGDTAAAEYNSFADLAVGCMWCIEQFENDIFPERVTAKANPEDLSTSDFIVDDELCVDDYVYSKVDGYLWATDPLVNRMKKAVSSELSSDSLSTVTNINFYAVYDLRTADIHIEGTFWYFEAYVEKQGTFNLSLSKGEQEALRTCLEEHCKKNYNMSCEEFVNAVRKEAGLDTKVSLDAKIKAAQVKIASNEDLTTKTPKTTAPDR